MASLDAIPSLIGRSAVAIAAQMADLSPLMLITLLIVIAAPSLVAAIVQIAATAVALLADDQQRAERALKVLEMNQRHRSRARRPDSRSDRAQPNDTDS